LAKTSAKLFTRSQAKELFVQLEQTLIAATQEIFSSMVMLGATPGTSYQRSDEPLIDGISGTICLEGKFTGILAIHLPSQTALEVSGSFLDLELEEIDADVCDAIGELTNMLAGNLKAAIDPSGSEIQLSIPETVYGEEYSIQRLPGAANITIPFYLDNGDFLVELQLVTNT
jgi:chemotaxis protein CheX